jgi:hypothetical protein
VSGHLLPRLLAVLTALAVGAGCTGGDGLRVEGTPSVTPAPSSPSSTPRALTTKVTPKIGNPDGTPSVTGRRAPSGLLSVAQLRQVLLTDPRVTRDIRNVVRTCRGQCVRPGVTADFIRQGTKQQVVLVNTADGLVFGAFLIGRLDLPKAEVIWALDTSLVRKVSAGRGGTLVVESAVFGRNDKICCPKGSKVEVYSWNGNRLVKTYEQFLGGAR